MANSAAQKYPLFCRRHEIEEIRQDVLTEETLWASTRGRRHVKRGNELEGKQDRTACFRWGEPAGISCEGRGRTLGNQPAVRDSEDFGNADFTVA